MEPLDPYSPPGDPLGPPRAENLKPLGSLAQSARGKEISQAKKILIAIGILTMIANGFLFYNLENEIQQAINKGQVDPAGINEFRQAATIAGYLLYGGPMLLGLLFVVFGLIVRKYPLAITVTSLVLYLGATLIFAVLNPESIVQGIIFKVIIIVALVKAIKAARAYNSETKKATVSDELFA